MASVTVLGFVYEVDYGFGDKEYRVFSSNTLADNHYTLVGPFSLDYEIPAGFNPTAAKLAALDVEEQKLRAAFNTRICELQEKRSKLQAIEYVEAV